MGVALSRAMHKCDFNRIVAELGSACLSTATNACGILATITLASQQARLAVASSTEIVSNIQLALSSDSNQLPHNAALLVSMLSTVGSFRRAFVRSQGLKTLVELLNTSDDPGEQCNVLFALVTLAGAGKDCHSELYEALVKSGVTWKARSLCTCGNPDVEANARTLAQKLRIMPQALALERIGSSGAVHALALLSCDSQALSPQRVTPRQLGTHSIGEQSPTRPVVSRKRKLEMQLEEDPSKTARLDSSCSGFGALDSLASVVQAASG